VTDFPIVLSNGPPDGFQTIADAGVTMIRAGRGDWNEASLDAQIAAERTHLDLAAAHGLKCWIWLGALTNLPAGANDSALRRVVEALKDHPALGAWKGHDEPRNPFNAALSVPPDNLARGHRVVASLDPNHPLVIIQAPRGSVDGLVPYRPAFDIGGVDIYPISYPARRRDEACVGDAANRLERHDRDRAEARPRAAVPVERRAALHGVSGDRERCAWARLLRRSRDGGAVAAGCAGRLELDVLARIARGPSP